MMKEIHLNTVDSTNTYAKKHVNTFVKGEITCISADEQTAGRARFQRTWLSPKGVNIYATFFFTLKEETQDLISLSQLMAISLAHLLQKHNLKPKIKWPNDVRLSDKKLAGILCETKFQNRLANIFLGIGINVNLEEKEAAKIDQPATSLLIETGRFWDRRALLKELQNHFIFDLLKFKEEGFTPFQKEFESLLALKNEKVRCFDGKQIWTGICHSINKEGQLNLLLEDGSIHTVMSGDIKS